MSRRYVSIVALLVALAISNAAIAQEVDITFSTTPVANDAAVGQPLNVAFDYSGPADIVTGFQFDLAFQTDELTITDFSNCGVNVPAGFNASCTNPSNGVVRIIVSPESAGNTLPTDVQNFGNWDFEVASAGDLLIQFTNATATDDATPIPNTIPMNASDIQVQASLDGPGYASDPVPEETIGFGLVAVGQSATLTGATEGGLTVSEIGNAQLDVDAPDFSGTNPGVFSSTTGAFSIADGGADQDVDLTCSPNADGPLSAVVTLTNNSVNEGSPTYDLTCEGELPDLQFSTTEINLSGLLNGPAPSGSTTLSNNATVADALNASIEVTSTDSPQLGATNGLADTTVSAGEDDQITFECATDTEGEFTESFVVEYDDPENTPDGRLQTAEVTVNCSITDDAPVYNSTPIAPDGEFTFGQVANGGSDSIAIDVFNDNENGNPFSITDVTSSDPNRYTVDSFNGGPYSGVAAPDGGDDIIVSCNPDGVGVLPTETLTVETDTAGTQTYDMTCIGTGEQVSVTPGALNLGTVPPGTQTPEGTVSFVNNTLDQSIDVNCTVTDEAGVFTFTPDPIEYELAAGAVEEARFQCTPPDISTFTADVSCTTTGQMEPVGGEARGEAPPLNFTVSCSGRPLVVPTMSSWGLVVMSLMLLLAGGFATRRMMA